ncbi:CRISPR-associated helicase Cas3' [Holzapfeliella sp. JNUCC 72]
MNKTKVLWAKKAQGDDGLPKWLPLQQHLLDTQAVIKLLYRFYLSENQRQVIRHSISVDSEIEPEQLISFIALTHDIGKATPVFQIKPSYQGIAELDEWVKENLIRENLYSDYELMDDKKSPHALAGEAILNYLGVQKDIAAIIGGHHGKPIDEQFFVESQIEEYVDNYYFEEFPDTEIYQNWKAIHQELFEWSLNISGYNTVDELPEIKDVSAQVILEGLLIMADWIASNENYFPLFNMNQFETENLNQRYQTGFKKWYRTPQEIPDLQLDCDSYYSERFGFTPNSLQLQLFEILNHTQNPGMIIIEAGMGIGKTEAALASVEQLMEKSQSTGLFYCLPTQATTNGIFSRIENWLSDIATQEHSNKQIRLVHGKAALNENFTKLPRYINIDVDDDQNKHQAGVLVNEWFSGSKTAILDDFVVGTIDQLLLMALKKKHLALRHLGFSKKVVVIDEAHSFDTYMQQYLTRALEWLGHYNIPVVILSATLPADKRIELIDAYQGRKVDVNADEIKSNLAYPLVTYTDGEQVNQLTDFETKSSKSVAVTPFEEDKLVSQLQTLLRDGGIAGIVVNTVGRSQALAQELQPIFGEGIEVLHSSFIATHRAKKEANLISTIGKNGDRPKRKIIIGTQVLEQSLDIDFDVLFTDIAPMDLLLQRIGRLHRHPKNNQYRPGTLKEPTVYVMQTTDDYTYDSGSSFIYGDYLLMRTQHCLPDQIQLPIDISTLVQKVYDFDTEIDMNQSYVEHYEDAKREHEIRMKRAKHKAQTYLLKEYNKTPNNLIGWLKNADNTQDAQGLAQVRDTEESIEVILVQELADERAYTMIGKDINIATEIDSQNQEVAKELAKQTLRLPHIFSKSYSIDKTIDKLEKETNSIFDSWQASSWLKGELGIKLDQHGQYELEGYQLTYDTKLGLIVNKKEGD